MPPWGHTSQHHSSSKQSPNPNRPGQHPSDLAYIGIHANPKTHPRAWWAKNNRNTIDKTTRILEMGKGQKRLLIGSLRLGWRPSLSRLEAIASRLEAIAIRYMFFEGATPKQTNSSVISQHQGQGTARKPVRVVGLIKGTKSSEKRPNAYCFLPKLKLLTKSPQLFTAWPKLVTGEVEDAQVDPAQQFGRDFAASSGTLRTVFGSVILYISPHQRYKLEDAPHKGSSHLKGLLVQRGIEKAERAATTCQDTIGKAQRQHEGRKCAVSSDSKSAKYLKEGSPNTYLCYIRQN